MSESPQPNERPLPPDAWAEAGNGGLHHLLGAGWSGPEPWGVWGVGAVHEFLLPLAEMPPGDIVFEADVHAVLLGPRAAQVIDVQVAGRRLAMWEFSRETSGGTREVRIEAALVRQAIGAHGWGALRIEFRPRFLEAPTELDPTVSESRPLGLALHRVRWRTSEPVEGARPATDTPGPAASGVRRMRVAVVTFVYNETVNLPIWRRYYGGVLGDRQLFVIDHGSTDGSTSDLGEISKLYFAREELDEYKRCVFMASFQKSLLEYFDIVIYTDCDEIIVPDPDRYRDLADYLDRMPFDHVAPIGLNVQHMIDQEIPLDLQEPILSQRRFVWFSSSESKPLISKVPLVWEAGFHGCNRPLNIDRDLFLFHLKRMDYSIGFQRHKITKEMKWAESSLAANHGVHARFDFPVFVRQSFLDPINALSSQGNLPFEFDKEIAQMEAEAAVNDGMHHTSHFAGRIAEIPARFRSIF